MNRTIKEATVRSYRYESHDQLRDHLAAFVAAYNFARRLKTLGGLTPFQAICKAWTGQPSRFRLSPDCGFRRDRATHSGLMPPPIPI